MKLLLLFAITLPMWAEDAPKPKEPTVAELKAENAALKEQVEQLRRIGMAYVQKFYTCDGDLTRLQALTPAPAPAKKEAAK